jgi:gluconate 2-dehydrogenase gamma chain
MGRYSRRTLIKGSVGLAAAVAGSAAEAQAPRDGASAQQSGESNGGAPQTTVLRFFSSEEARFVAAATDRLIPADAQWGGAVDAGVPDYIDLQLASAYGAGARMYLAGPWDPEAPAQQGYQLKYSPADLYRVAIREIREQVAMTHGGKELWDLGASDIDAVLSALETGRMALPSLPSAVFFETLLANTIEGYFADPAYGGNRDMVSWRMIGFPGAFAQYVDLVDRHGFVFEREPIGIANGSALLSREH